ncbi:MAG TPA: sugar ABC transporter permease [Bacilli bacterium]|nr:sugar ABC transporter permease [Bacilli bacterium]HRU49417.1 sugar ABC transporter permease [Bacilli bacterium]
MWFIISIMAIGVIVVPGITLAKKLYDRKKRLHGSPLPTVTAIRIFDDDTVRDRKYYLNIWIKVAIIGVITFLALYVVFVHKWIFGARPPKLLVWLCAFYLIVTYFVQDGLAADFAEKKGYGQLSGALWGLIPVYGLLRYAKKPKRKNVQSTTIKKIYSSKSLIAKYLIFAELVGLGIIVLLPIIYIVGASFAKQSGLPTTFWPRNLTLENYRILFDESETMFVHWYKNTFFLALLNMVFGVLFITGAAYIFARFKFKGKKIGLITILVLQVFPSFMGMVALFTLYQTFNLVGRPLALTFIYVGGSVPFNLWLIKGYLQQIPRDLDESAMLDGANKAQIFFKIILPLSVPILSFVAVSQFMAPWMDYILPSFLLNIVPRNANIPAGMNLAEYTKMQWTLAVGLFEFISGTNSEYTTFAAGAIIVALPITVLYMLFQRFLIQGITAGATKG